MSGLCVLSEVRTTLCAPIEKREERKRSVALLLSFSFVFSTLNSPCNEEYNVGGGRGGGRKKKQKGKKWRTSMFSFFLSQHVYFRVPEHEISGLKVQRLGT
jgi:hypothetical protein